MAAGLYARYARRFADGDVLEPFGDEQLAGGVENRPPDSLPVAFLSLFDTHVIFNLLSFGELVSY
jgi:hypothetical protein